MAVRGRVPGSLRLVLSCPQVGRHQEPRCGPGPRPLSQLRSPRRRARRLCRRALPHTGCDARGGGACAGGHRWVGRVCAARAGDAGEIPQRRRTVRPPADRGTQAAAPCPNPNSDGTDVGTSCQGTGPGSLQPDNLKGWTANDAGARARRMSKSDAAALF